MDPNFPSERSRDKLEFINQMSRKLMVEICDVAIRCPDKPVFTGGQAEGEFRPYYDHMKSKGWISKDGTRVLAAGWQTAARFLKR